MSKKAKTSIKRFALLIGVLIPLAALAQQTGPYMRLRLQTAGTTPPTGYVNVFAKSADKHVYAVDSTATETDLTGGGGGGVELDEANTWTASQNVASVALSDGANIATDASLGNVFTVTLEGDRTLDNPTNLVAGGTYLWVITQDGTGTQTLAYGNKFKWPSGVAPTLSIAAASVDMVSCVYTGTTLKCVAQLDFE